MTNRRKQINGPRKKVIVVMPAYNAEKTIKDTVRDIPKRIVDEIILVDDASSDNTAAVAASLGLTVIKHKRNKGYGANQKTCYAAALKRKADIIVMIHPDYQYDSSLLGDIIAPIQRERFDIMFGSRIRTRKEALQGGMPVVKYFVNRIVSLIENILLGVNFTEHMSGYRAYSKKVLQTLPLHAFSDDFVFDQQFMISSIAYGFSVGEYPVPVRYFSKASSISWLPGVKFILYTMWTLVLFILFKLRLYTAPLFLYKH